MCTITICTDDEGRVTALVVPEGGCATVIAADVEDAFAARFGGDGERIFKYDPDNDYGFSGRVTRGFRSRQRVTVHDLSDA